MILKALRLVRTLSRRQCAVVIFTIVISTLFFPLLQSWIPGGPVGLAVIYLGWIAIVFLSVASMLEEDRSKAEEGVDQKLNVLSTEVQRLKDEHSRTTAGLKDQMTEIDKDMRSTFKLMGVVVPRRPISLRADFSAGAPTISASATVVGESRIARFRRWIKNRTLRFWRWLYG